MSNNFSSNKDAHQNEDGEVIDIIAIGNSVKRHSVLILICIAVAIAGAFGAWKITPAQWKSSATLQIGQLPGAALIESTAQAAERFNQRQLQNEALTTVGLPLDEFADERTRIMRKTLKAIPGKNTNFVDVSVAAFSREDAKTYLSAAMLALIHTHDIRLAPLIKNLDDRIADNNLQLSEAKNEKVRLESSLKNASASPNESKFAPSVVAISLASKQDDLIRGLTAERAALADQHTKTNTFPTMVVNAIYVPIKPESPKLLLYLLFSLIIGGGVGVALALFLDRNHPKTSP